MDLPTIWFILIAVLYTGYFVLEGFDFGVGILLPFLGQTDLRRRVIINTIGPHWDGNEVWLLTAGGATFAAFPQWYATLFSGFYLPLFLILLALIFRGVAFEFRSKDENPRWRSLWDWAIFLGSFLPALLWGVAFANFMIGVPLDGQMNYVGGFWNLLNPYALVGGLLSLTVFTLQGAIFLSLKTEGKLMEMAKRVAGRVWVAAIVLAAAFTAWTFFATGLQQKGVVMMALPVVAAALLLAAGLFVRQGRTGLAFILNSLAIVLGVVTVFALIFPNALISNPAPEFSLTIWKAASSNLTLTVMSVVALIFVPIVLAYQGWTYWIFRKRLVEKAEHLEY
ncbi:MAG TPA: cytochrome d ubiquinol oxidase subunit II [Anaerolineaceae bacterium]|mgnify:CR=1 FL=1|nr:cytochrome d ubiquinol oxidase subunit II [Anaerolineaceae bacterium]HPN53757.1 cytochrome d ubiquinol oxidase subunit II [Anaerolineaceae bacterium]